MRFSLPAPSRFTLRYRVLLPVALCVLCASVVLSSAHAEDAPGLAGDALAKDDPAKDALAKKKADIIFRIRVKKAIANGARWIADHQRKDGSFRLDKNNGEGPFPQSRHRFGISTLCLYTLADCGYGADHPVVKKALSYVRKHYRSYMKGDHWPQASAYSLSILVLGLHNLYVKPANRTKLDERDRYGARKKDKKNPCGYPTWARTLINEILDWLMAHQSKEGLFRYPGGFNTGTRAPGGMGRPASHFGDEDLSNTQYVLLALWAGSRCGYDIPNAKLVRIAERLLAWQETTGPQIRRVEDPKPTEKAAKPKGKHKYAEPAPPTKQPEYTKQDHARGFPYTPGARVTGSMTTAGLSSLLILKGMLLERRGLTKGLRKKLDRGIWDAIAWMQVNYSLTTNPGMGTTWQYYYLYGLERAFVIAAKRLLGEHDWYREGAEMLVKDQKADGRWQPPGQLGMFGAGPQGASMFKTDVLDTCFALLFLKRTTITPKKPVLDDPGPVTTPSGG